MKFLRDLHYVFPVIVEMPAWGKVALGVCVLSGAAFIVAYWSTTYRINEAAALKSAQHAFDISKKDINRLIDDYERATPPLLESLSEDTKKNLRDFASRGTAGSSMHQTVQQKRALETTREIEARLTALERAVEDIVFEQFHVRDIGAIHELLAERDRLNRVKAAKRGLLAQVEMMAKVQ